MILGINAKNVMRTNQLKEKKDMEIIKTLFLVHKIGAAINAIISTMQEEHNVIAAILRKESDHIVNLNYFMYFKNHYESVDHCCHSSFYHSDIRNSQRKVFSSDSIQ